MVIVMGFAYSFLMTIGKALNALMLREKDAEYFGIRVEYIKNYGNIISIMVGIAVALSGSIAFVGLIVPYILRLIFKSNHAVIHSLAAVCGSVFLLEADTLSSTLVAPSELPIVLLTALIGAPEFIAILIRFKNSM